MQAIIFFSLFMFVAGVFGQLMLDASQTTQALNQQAVAQVRAYFENIRTVLMADDVQRTLRVAPRTTCSGPNPATYSATNIQPYICSDNMAQLAMWRGADDGRRDPWGNPFDGVVQHVPTAMFAGGANAIVVPVTAVAMASPGPDRQFGASLSAAFTNLRSAPANAATLRSILLLQNNPAEVNGADDLVLTFSTQRALEDRWARLERALTTISRAALRNYNQQFQSFSTQLSSFYGNNLNAFYDAGGNIRLTTGTLGSWRNTGVALPTGAARPQFDATMFAGTPAGHIQRTNLGVDEAFDLIETQSNMALDAALGTTQDTLVLNLRNNGSPWGGAAGTFNYTQQYTTQ
jgi:hypothetical protein